MSETEGRGIKPKIGTLVAEVRIPGSRDLIEVYKPKQEHASQPVNFLRYNILKNMGWKEETTVTWPNGSQTTYPAGYQYRKAHHLMTVEGLKNFVSRTYHCEIEI